MSTMDVDDGGGRIRKVPVDYPSNSKKSKQEPAEKPKQEKIIEGEVVRRKKGFVGRLKETFIAEDASSVMAFIFGEVLVPAAKNAVQEMFEKGLERMLYGDTRPRHAAGGRPGGYTNYSRVRETYSDRRELSRQSRATHDFSEFILASRGEAEDVLDRLRDLIDQYGLASVAEFYDLIGITGEFTDDKWGWQDLRSASVRAVRGGYMLVLPRTHPIT